MKMMNWNEEILSRIDIAFWIQIPLENLEKIIESVNGFLRYKNI